MTQQIKIALSGLILFFGVGAGAFGAHALRALLTPREVEVWKTAVLYHLIHGLGLLLVVVFNQLRPSPALAFAWMTMLLGVVLFSGSLYLITLTGWRWLGPVTPLGGVALMISWLLVSWAGLRHWS